MQKNHPVISDLRQWLDVLGAQIETPGNVDRAVVMATCRNIAFAAADKARPIPEDVFAPGVSDTLMRCALTGLCMAVVQPLLTPVRKT